jgi:hypothetical protein
MATNLRTIKGLDVQETAQRVGFLQDDQGHQSSMRLMSLIALLTAVVFGALSVLAAIEVIGNGSGGADAITITFGFLVAAFAPKAVQKFAEQKTERLAR